MMQFKKTYTMVPECSLGIVNSNGCGHPCDNCDAATKSKTRVLQVPDDQPVIIAASISKETIYGGEVVDVRIEFDRPINKNDIFVDASYGLIITPIMDISDKIFLLTFASNTSDLGNKNITVGYKGINRVFHVNVIKGLPKIEDLDVSPSTVEYGENILITINLNRELEETEIMPEIIYDTEAFDVIDVLEPLPITRACLRCTLQAKDVPGTYKFIARFPGQIPVDALITIDTPERIEWATKEDIDGLFPELKEEDKPTTRNLIQSKQPNSTDDAVYATEADIDALFPELHN